MRAAPAVQSPIPARRITRNRPHVSCAECIRRKVRCDRRQPCAPCKTRGHADQCYFQLAARTPAQRRRSARQLEESELPADTLDDPSHHQRWPEEITPAEPRVAIPRNQMAQITPTSPAPRRLATPPLFGRGSGADGDADLQMAEPTLVIMEDYLTHSHTTEDSSELDSLHLVDDADRDTILEGSPEFVPAMRRLLVPRLRPPLDSLIEWIYSVLPPSKPLIDLIVDRYWSHSAWRFKVLHRPSFMEEYHAFGLLLQSPSRKRVDPLWLAILLMMLNLAMSSWDFSDSAISAAFGREEFQAIPEKLSEAACIALHCGDWMGKPKIRTLQAIALLNPYLRSRVQPNARHRLEMYNVCAVRIATALKLHILPDDPACMPPPDLAFDTRAGTLRRQVSLQLLYSALAADQEGSGHRPLSLQEVTSTLPGNYDDDQFSLEGGDIPEPRTHISDASFVIIRFELACISRRYSNLIRNGRPSYRELVELDNSMKSVLRRYELDKQSPRQSLSRFWTCQATLVDVYALRIRFYRPYLFHSRKLGSDHEQLKAAILDSARSLLRCGLQLHQTSAPIIDGPYGLSRLQIAVLILVQKSWLVADSSKEVQAADDELLNETIKIFELQAGSSRADVAKAAKIGASMLSALVQTLSDRRKFAGLNESFAHALKRISTIVRKQQEQSSAAVQPLDDMFANLASAQMFSLNFDGLESLGLAGTSPSWSW